VWQAILARADGEEFVTQTQAVFENRREICGGGESVGAG
jgi:hypothetical protein